MFAHLFDCSWVLDTYKMLGSKKQMKMVVKMWIICGWHPPGEADIYPFCVNPTTAICCGDVQENCMTTRESVRAEWPRPSPPPRASVHRRYEWFRSTTTGLEQAAGNMLMCHIHLTYHIHCYSHGDTRVFVVLPTWKVWHTGSGESSRHRWSNMNKNKHIYLNWCSSYRRTTRCSPWWSLRRS